MILRLRTHTHKVFSPHARVSLPPTWYSMETCLLCEHMQCVGLTLQFAFIIMHATFNCISGRSYLYTAIWDCKYTFE